LARIRQAFAVLGLALGAACTAPSGPAATPVEQLPNPEFDRKPQILFVVDADSKFWNAPLPAEVELKHRVRLTLSDSSSLETLVASLQDFNSREGDLLLFSGTRLLPSAKKLALFSHPSGRRTFWFSPTPDTENPSVRLDLGTALEVLKIVCARFEKSAGHHCSWDSKIPGAPTQPPSKTKPLPLAFASSTLSESRALRLELKIDWVQWMEQFLRSLASGSEKADSNPAPWRTISLESGTLRLEVLGSDPSTEELRRILQEERLKRL
jgi:hypothetical protein